MGIYDTMKFIRPKVCTICVGLAASMGALLLSSGEKGRRYALPHSRVMIHQPLGGIQGQATEIEIPPARSCARSRSSTRFLPTTAASLFPKSPSTPSVTTGSWARRP